MAMWFPICQGISHASARSADGPGSWARARRLDFIGWTLNELKERERGRLSVLARDRA